MDVDEIIRQIAVFFDDLSTKLNELLALIKSNDTQGIENWKKLNKEEFDTFIKYSASGGAQSTSSAVRDEAIRQLKEQLFGAGTTGTTEQNVKELLAQISLKKLAEELKNAKIPSEDSKNVSILTAQTWITPAGSPFELPANTKINNYFYCYWGLEKNIKAGALRGFSINGVNYAAAFSGSNEFLGYYDFDEWKAKGSPTDAKKYEVNDTKSYEILTGLRDVYVVCYDGEPMLGTFTKVSIKKVQATFDPKKLVAWRFLDKQIATVTLSANNQTVITSNNLTFSCSKSVGKGDFATLYNYCKNIDDNSIIERLKDLIKAKGKTDKELYFDEIITIDSDADKAKKDAALARLTSVATEVSNKRVLYLMFDANKNLFETKSAFGTEVTIDVKGALEAITKVIGKHESKGIFVVTKIITAIFQGLEEVLNSLEIPVKYYDSDDKANYDPWLYDLWEVINVANPASSTVRLGLFQAPGIKLPGETYDPIKMSKPEFALYCGLWNGLIGQIKGIAGSAALVSQAPEYVYHLIFNIDNEATNLGNKIKNFSFTAVGHMIAEKLRQNNANQNAHLYGEVVTNILTIYLSIAKVGKISQVIGTLDKLDAISQTLSLTGKAFKTSLNVAIKGGKIVFKIKDASQTVFKGFVSGVISTPKGVLSATIPFGPQIVSGIDGGIDAFMGLIKGVETKPILDASGNLVTATVEEEVKGAVKQVEGILHEVKLEPIQTQDGLTIADGENTMLVIVTKSADDVIASLRAKVSTWSVADADRFIADFTGNNDAINRFLGGFVSPEAWLTVSKAGRNEAAKSLKVLEGLSSLGLPNSTLVADFLKFSDKTIIKFAEDLYGPANAYFSTFLKDNPNVLKALVQHKEDSYAKYVAGAIAQVSELEFTDPNLFKKLDDWIRYSLETKTFLNRMTQARKFQRDLYAKVVKKENFLKSAEEVTFDVTINGVTDRTRLDGIFFDNVTGKYIVFEAKLGDAVLSDKQKIFFKALKDGVGEIKPVAGKAGDVFLPSEIGKDVRAKFSDSYYLNEDLINIKQ